MGRIRRWLGSAEKRRLVRDAIKKVKLELCLIQETKLDENKRRFVENFASFLNMQFEFVLLVGVMESSSLAGIHRLLL